MLVLGWANAAGDRPILDQHWDSVFRLLGRPKYTYITIFLKLSFFVVAADMLKEIFDHIPLFSLSKKNPVLDQNVS